MANEVLIGRLYDIIDEVTRLGGEQERTSIVPGILVADANPSDLPTGYIKIVNPRDGTYVPCLTVNGLVVSDNDLVNVLFTKGTEPIALSQSAGSPSSSIKVSELWDSNFGAVAWQTNAAGHLSATGKDLTTSGDISAGDFTASGNILLTSGGTVVAGSGSSNPSLGTEASGGRWGSIFIASGYQINTLASLDISAGAIGSEVVMIRLNNTAQDVLFLGSMPSTSDDVDVNINNGQVFVEGSSGNVGIGISAPEKRLSIVLGAAGGILSSDVVTDATTKDTRFLLRHYNNSEEAIACFGGASLSASTEARFGGGYGVQNAVTRLRFFTAANNTTLTGSERMTIDENGNVGINIAVISAKLHVDQPSTTAAIPTLTLDQADLSEEFIEFISTVGAGNPIDTAAIGTYYGKVRVSVAGVGFKFIPLHNS